MSFFLPDISAWGKDFPHAGATTAFPLSPAPHSSGEIPATPPCRLRREDNCVAETASPLIHSTVLASPQTRLSRERATVCPVLTSGLPWLPPGFAAGRSDRRFWKREASRALYDGLRRGKCGAARQPKAAASLLMRKRATICPDPAVGPPSPSADHPAQGRASLFR